MSTDGPSRVDGSALHGLDPVFTAPKRLAMAAVLAGSTSADFGFLRDHLGISDSDLSKQAAALESAGYIDIHKSGRGRGAVTSYRLTGAGRRAYRTHRSALERLLAGS